MCSDNEAEVEKWGLLSREQGPMARSLGMEMVTTSELESDVDNRTNLRNLTRRPR